MQINNKKEAIAVLLGVHLGSVKRMRELQIEYRKKPNKTLLKRLTNEESLVDESLKTLELVLFAQGHKEEN